MININGEKMSKSLGNFITIEGLLDKYDANTIRFFILTNNYRMPVEFNDEALEAAQAGAKRLKNAANNVLAWVGKDALIDVAESDEIEEFKAAMNDDFNTSKALAVLFETATNANKAKDENDKDNAIKYISILIKLARVLGFDLEKVELDENQLKEKLAEIIDEFDFIEDKDIIAKASAKEIMEKIIQVRNEARAQKNWAVADNIRNSLDKINIVLKDSKEGTVFELK